VKLFDEIHVISDLHLGGAEGFQIFGSTVELSGLIVSLANAGSGVKVALVINGDFVDFLAEQPAAHFSPSDAVQKLQRVVEDPAFSPVFSALSKFASTANRTLVINLGNHDIELAVPWVREEMTRTISGDDLASRGRIHWITDGTGFSCTVGAARVLCVHGNEVDSWNVVDHERLRRISRDSQFGVNVAPWDVNAGTRMVIEVMNGIKHKYPFVDLLKPEKEGVVPTLLAIDPSATAKLTSILSVAARMGIDGARMSMGFLGDAADSVNTTTPYRQQEPGIDLVRKVERQFAQNEVPMSMVAPEQGEQLGVISAIFKNVMGKSKSEVLRDALEDLDKDRSFDPTVEDDTFRDLDKAVGTDIDFLVAGHTHLERALQRKRGKGYYFNSGTWARLMQVLPEVRQDEGKFEDVYKAIKAGTLAALDEVPGLVQKRCSVVSIWQEQGATFGELRRVPAGGGAPVSVPETKFQAE
jgi:UDP-2,3-diacylglucosamine pyrophosphatase LpxH